jgi:hypothetical protein
MPRVTRDHRRVMSSRHDLFHTLPRSMRVSYQVAREAANAGNRRRLDVALALLLSARARGTKQYQNRRTVLLWRGIRHVLESVNDRTHTQDCVRRIAIRNIARYDGDTP